MFRNHHLIFPAICFAIQSALVAILSWQTSINRTEVGHIGAAVYFCKTFKFNVFHVNPPLTRMVVGAPLLLNAGKYDWTSYSPRPQDRTEWMIGNSFINANTPSDIHKSIFWARCSLIPFILLGSWFGHRLAVELYGQTAGVLFLILWTFSPLILAWSATICPDVVASSLGIVAVYYLWHWLKKPTWKGTVIAGICLGSLPLAKITWVVAFPLWIVIWGIWRLLSRHQDKEERHRPNGKQLAAILLIGVYMINMGYLFDGSFRQLKDYRFISNTLTGFVSQDEGEKFKAIPGNRFAESWLGQIPVPLPGEFVQGIDTQKLDFERGIESYFRGTYSRHGWWYYYPYVVLIKEPLGILCLGLMTMILTCVCPKYNASLKEELVILLPCITIFLFVSSQTGFSLHPRYIIPALPFAYIWISKLGQVLSAKRCVFSTTIVILLAWFIGSSLYYFPHSMSYFNELIGGPVNGPRHLLGSNIDWGQNSYFLKKWVDSHPEAIPLRVAYAGAESMKRLGISDDTLPPDRPEPGWYAIGVHELYGSSRPYDYFHSWEPVDRIGYSISIYHVTPEQAELANKTLQGESP